MRISDWSSDVCSSDLVPQWHEPARRPVQQASGARQGRPQLRGKLPEWCVRIRRWQYPHVPQPRSDCPSSHPNRRWVGRSEEHTSELQSLMRISYAVFCLKNKTYIPVTTHHILISTH